MGLLYPRVSKLGRGVEWLYRDAHHTMSAMGLELEQTT